MFRRLGETISEASWFENNPEKIGGNQIKEERAFIYQQIFCLLP